MEVGGPKGAMYEMGIHIPMGRGNFEGEGVTQCKV